jgi:TrpR-related protein YerC/YecD
MKHAKASKQRSSARAERSLFRALLALEDERECRNFLLDLCTPAEFEALVDRWSVVAYLDDGLPYRKIHDLTGVSVTTIGRVARFLAAGNGGYRAALERLGAGMAKDRD